MAGVAVVLVVSTVLFSLLLYVRWRLFWHRALAPFGGPGLVLPVVGSLPYIFGPMSTILERGLVLFQKYGAKGHVLFWLGERPVLHIMRPEDLECLLGSNKQTQKLEILYKIVSGFFGRY